MDLRVHPTVRPLTPEYLAEATVQQQQQQQLIQQQQQQQSNEPNTTAGGGGPPTNETNATTTSKPKPVILAPFGLAATLTGQSFRSLDPVTQKSFDDWCSFYPLCNRDNANLPPMVEVITGMLLLFKGYIKLI